MQVPRGWTEGEARAPRPVGNAGVGNNRSLVTPSHWGSGKATPTEHGPRVSGAHSFAPLSLSVPVWEMGITVHSPHKSWESREEMHLLCVGTRLSTCALGAVLTSELGTARAVRGSCAAGVQVCPPVKLRTVSAPESVPAVLAVRPPGCSGESGVLLRSQGPSLARPHQGAGGLSSPTGRGSDPEPF